MAATMDDMRDEKEILPVLFTTYTNEVIHLCDNCPQHKSNIGGWEITQCNDCANKYKEDSLLENNYLGEDRGGENYLSD